MLSFFFHFVICFFVKNQVFVDMWINIWVFDLGSFCSPVCFYTNIRVFSVLYLCSEVWSQGLWWLQKFLYCTWFFWLSRFFCISIWGLYCSFEDCEEFCWDFDGHCTESVDCFWKDCHFYYVNSTYPSAWEIFPFSDVFFNYLLQRFKVLVIQIQLIG